MVRPWYWPDGGQPHRTEPFTWIVKGKMAASWWPDPPVFKRYKKEGIKVIINASEFDNRQDVPEEFVYYHIDIPDYGLPTDDQIKRFIKITSFESNDPLASYFVMVSCLHSVASEDEVHEFRNYSQKEIDDFMENVSGDVVKGIQKFFETMPKLRHEMKYTNSNGDEKTFVLEGIRSFFT